jgi:uncharacterized protein with HEPN domain
MPGKDPRLYLIHIRDACHRVLEYTAGRGPDWSESSLLLDAVCRNLEIIGEASAKLDLTYREQHPEIPWRSIIDTRNVLIHAYDQVKPLLLSDIVERDIPNLLGAVNGLLAASDPDNE